jgi:hypothetical protein
VSAAGEVVTRVTASKQLVPKGRLVVGQKVPVGLLPYSASASRLYYIDGSTLKYVTPQGGAGTVRALDGGQRQYSIATNADDRRIAIAEFDYSSPPARFQLWVEDVGGGHRTDLTLHGFAYGWPYGWSNGQLIVIETDAYQRVSDEGDWFVPLERKAHLIDPITGAESASLCSWPIGGRALCRDSNQELFLESWDGSLVAEP